MLHPTKYTAAAIGAMALLAASAAGAADSNYPNKPIRLLVPFAAGGTTTATISRP